MDCNNFTAYMYFLDFYYIYTDILVVFKKVFQYRLSVVKLISKTYLISGLCPSGIFRDTPTSAGPLRKSTFTDFPITQTASFR